MPDIVDLRNIQLPKQNAPPAPSALPQEPQPDIPLTSAPPAVAHAESVLGAHADPRELIAWDAPEFESRPDQKRFVLAISALFIAGAIVALVLGNYLFAILLIISGGLIGAQAYRTPQVIHAAITLRGITVDHRLYEFNSLESFWIAYDPPLFREIRLLSQKTLLPAFHIPLGNADPLQIRDILLRFLPEKKQDDTFIDIVSRRLGF